MENATRPKHKRIRYTRGKGRRINLKGGLGHSSQSTQTSTELVLWDSAIHTPNMETDEAMSPGIEGQNKISVSFLGNSDELCDFNRRLTIAKNRWLISTI